MNSSTPRDTQPKIDEGIRVDVGNGRSFINPESIQIPSRRCQRKEFFYLEPLVTTIRRDAAYAAVLDTEGGEWVGRNSATLGNVCERVVECARSDEPGLLSLVA
jgi:hypothetical protein